MTIQVRSDDSSRRINETAELNPPALSHTDPFIPLTGINPPSIGKPYSTVLIAAANVNNNQNYPFVSSASRSLSIPIPQRPSPSRALAYRVGSPNSRKSGPIYGDLPDP